MPEDVIAKVVQMLKKLQPEDYGNPSLSEEIYSPVGFARQNFHALRETECNFNILCVDGGNLEILTTPSISVSFVRVAGIGFRKLERQKNDFMPRVECFCVASTLIEEGKRKMHLKYLPTRENFARYLPEEYTITTDIPRIETMLDMNLRPISIVSGIARKYAELYFLNQVLEYLEEGDFVLRDGVFQANDEIERELISQIVKKSKERSIGLAGLAKTTTLLTDRGIPISQALQSLAEQWGIEAPWYYFPIAQNKEPESWSDIYFVKFCNSQNYAFRFDVMPETIAEVEPLLSFLHSHSKNCIFPGYPYILLAADKSARVEQKEAKTLSLKLKAAMGRDRELERAINCLSAHELISRY